MEYFILNEHSLPIARDIEYRCLNQFFDVYKEAMDHNFKQILIPNSLDPHWYEIPTSEGRTIRSWINEQSRDYATRVKSLIQSIERPKFRMEDIQGPHISKFYYNGNSVKFLGAAYLLEQLAFSFGSDEMWNEPFFSLECDELVSNDIKVSNVTTRDHWDMHFKQILEEHRKQALSSDDIEKRIKEEYPNIIFTNDASKQIKNEHSPIFLSEIWDACEKLNEVVERVGDQVSYHHVISETDLQITDESTTVKENGKLKRYRMKMYDGKRHSSATISKISQEQKECILLSIMAKSLLDTWENTSLYNNQNDIELLNNCINQYICALYLDKFQAILIKISLFNRTFHR